MRLHLLRRVGVMIMALGVLVAGTGCGGGGTGSGPGSGAVTTGGAGGAGAGDYAVKTDLCAQADLAPLKAVLPAMVGIEPQGKTFNGAPVFYCDGNAGKTDQYNDIGFFGLAAYLFSNAEDASRQYGSATSPTRATEVQPISGLGQQAVSYQDGREIRVAVLDGAFYFSAYWVANSGELPAAQRDEVRHALVATTEATLAKLRKA